MSQAFKIPITQGAFRVKRPRIEKPPYLAWLRQLPCTVTGRTDQIEAAHIRFGDLAYGKTNTGKGEKPSDRWALPLTAEQHRKQHAQSEREYWAAVGVDPLLVALALHGAYPDVCLAAQIITVNRALAKMPAAVESQQESEQES